MGRRRKKATIDDGMNPELVRGAKLVGIFGIAELRANKHIMIPDEITPFSYRDRDTDRKKHAVGFYEMDEKFSDFLKDPDRYIEQLRPFGAMITLDCSLYRNAPLAVQIANIYKSRAIGYRAQSRGLYVIPQIRWGSEETYTTKVLPEKVAFTGAPRKSIVAIGTYGCISGQDNKYHFEAGLESMLIELEPKVVLVYGPMPDRIFGNYLSMTEFHQYDDWMSRMKRG